MKKFKKIITAVLAAALVIGASFSVWANPEPPISESRFGAFTGTAKIEGDGGKYGTYTLTGSEDYLMEVTIDESTILVTDNKITSGSKITFFYDKTLPMTLQYPPRLTALVAAVDLDKNIEVSLFDETLTNVENTLKITIDEKTEVVNADNSEYNGSLANKELIVIYGASTKSIPAQTVPEKIIVINGQEESKNYYNTFSGKIKEINDFYQNEQVVEGKKFIWVEDGEQPATFFVTEETFFATDAELKEGADITGYYRADMPMMLIYPPRYNVQVVVVGSDDKQTVKADRFDSDLVSSDNSLKIIPSDKTEIFDQDGNKFDGSLAGRKLVVYYGVSTRSIPAQTTPDKIVVLHDDIVPADINDISKISVNGKIIEAQAPFAEGGFLMLPLRDTAEALGYTVSWNEEGQNITLDSEITLAIGKDVYTNVQLPLHLGVAPMLVDGKTYVPEEFFSIVLKAKVELSEDTAFIKTL